MLLDGSKPSTRRSHCARLLGPGRSCNARSLSFSSFLSVDVRVILPVSTHGNASKPKNLCDGEIRANVDACGRWMSAVCGHARQACGCVVRESCRCVRASDAGRRLRTGSRAAARQARADAGGRRTGHMPERQGLADLSWCALASVIWSRTRTKPQTTRVCNTLKFCNTENVCTVSFGRPRSDASAHPTGQLVPASLACGPCAYPPRPPAPAARLRGCCALSEWFDLAVGGVHMMRPPVMRPPRRAANPERLDNSMCLSQSEAATLIVAAARDWQRRKQLAAVHGQTCSLAAAEQS